MLSPPVVYRKRNMSGFYDIAVRGLDGSADLLGTLEGNVTLAVNVASRCGLTPQYAGLEELHRELRAERFTVIGFPCNQFGAQEPGGEAEIGAFCQKNYGVSFPMFAKIEVNGPRAHPLYKYLKDAKPGLLGSENIKWNFTKFLIDKAGRVVRRYAPTEKPGNLARDIEPLLG